jgi:26S proteasome regulatory subunit N7
LNLGDTELRDALMKRARFFLRIGDKSRAVAAYRETQAKTVGAGPKLELALAMVRIGFFFEDAALVGESVGAAKQLIEQGGDWDRRNRLKVYEAVHLLAQRRFELAAPLLLETLSTYNAAELMPFDDFVRVAALAALLHLERRPLREKVAGAAELVKLRAAGDATCRAVDALLDGQYRAYFEALVAMHADHKRSALLASHAAYCLRELRVRGYKQQLASYRSVKLDVMARSFGVSVDFLDRELARFISLGRLPCKIDKVAGVVEMQRPDAKAEAYAQSLKQGDALLNRIQKLARVINQ